MNPSLGFSSTIGAFIGGAAKEGKNIIDSDRAAETQQAQQDAILAKTWAFKTDLAKQAKAKDDRQNQIDGGLYNTLLDATGGNTQLADNYFASARTAKGVQLQELLARAHDAGMQAPKTPQGYQSPNHYPNPNAGLQGNTGSTVPNNDLDGNSGSNPSSAQSTPSSTQAPTTAPTDTSDQVAQPTSAPTAPSTQYTDQSQSNGAGPSANAPQVTTTPNTVVAGNKAQLLDPNAQPTGTQSPTTTGPITPNPNTSAAPYNPYPHPSSNIKAPIGPPGEYSNSQGYQDALVASGVSLNDARMRAANAMTADKVAAQKGAENPKQGFTPLETKFSDALMNPKGEFSDANYANAKSVVQNCEIAKNMLMQGNMKTGAMQPMYDSIGRFAQALGIPEAQTSGISNNVQAYNMMMKIQSFLQFSQTSKYHLGRYTQLEVGMIGKQVLNGANDPDTNIKLALLLGKAAEFQMNTIGQMHQAAAVHGGNKADIDSAMKLHAASFGDSKTDALPWIQINGSDPKTMGALATAQPGQWVENVNTGKMQQVTQNNNGVVSLSTPYQEHFTVNAGQH